MTYTSLLTHHLSGASSGRVVDPAEIGPGIALHMDPDTLAAEGATYTCPEARRVRGCHFFLCIRITGEHSRWLPLYSRGGLNRLQLSQRGRSGHPKWMASECYYYADQVWCATHAAVAAATLAGQDRSERKRRNRIAIRFLPAV